MVSEGRAGWRTGLKDLRGKQSRASKHIAQGCFDKNKRGAHCHGNIPEKKADGIDSGGAGGDQGRQLICSEKVRFIMNGTRLLCSFTGREIFIHIFSNHGRKRLQHLLAVCLICRPAALQRWGWKKKKKRKKRIRTGRAENVGLLEKQNVSNDGRLSVSAASYLHSEKLSGAALSGSRHGPRRSYFSL